MKTSIWSVLLAFFLFITDLYIPLLDTQSTTESLPVYIDVTMYQLTPEGARGVPHTLCMPGDTLWGCTAFCDNTNPEYEEVCERTRTLGYPSTYTDDIATAHIEHDYLGLHTFVG